MANRRHFSYIGYHGCEKELARRLILREVEMGKSANPYDWLGHGIYFWENDVKRALEFARDVKKMQRAICHRRCIRSWLLFRFDLPR